MRNSFIQQTHHESKDVMNSIPNPQQEHRYQLEEERSIQLFLSVPAGLEDVAVRKLPTLLVETASKISYRIGSGYLTASFFGYAESPQVLDNDKDIITRVIEDLVQHPPLCIFAAYISIGTIAIPRKIFDSSKNLLAYVLGGFQQPQQQQLRPQGILAHGSDTHNGRASIDLGLHWHKGLAVLRRTPSSLAERLDSTFCETDQDLGNLNDAPPIRFRASFDRGDIQHKGVRSQDLAAGIGGVTGKVFSSWVVDLEDYDIEVMGRWIPEDLKEFDFKLESLGSTLGGARLNKGNEAPLGSRSNAAPGQECTSEMKMQVGITLPLALSTCPYRFRPMDGRTSLKIEIAYTLLAMADPMPGNVVVDMCSGVGTIPIVGAVHYPECFFTGIEIVPYNVEKAEENSKAMVEKANQERLKSEKTRPIFSSTVKAPFLARSPSLLLGDAKAVCWRSNIVELIISDLPWGQRENSHLYNCKLYPKFVKEIIRLLKVNGRAVLITGERKLLQRQLDAPFAKPYLRLIQKREITIGFKVMVFELQRI